MSSVISDKPLPQPVHRTIYSCKGIDSLLWAAHRFAAPAASVRRHCWRRIELGVRIVPPTETTSTKNAHQQRAFFELLASPRGLIRIALGRSSPLRGALCASKTLSRFLEPLGYLLSPRGEQTKRPAQGGPFRLYGVPKGIRTPVTAVKGRCPRPLDDGDSGRFVMIVVELGGIEPPTSCMPCKRSPSGAIAPRSRGLYGRTQTLSRTSEIDDLCRINQALAAARAAVISIAWLSRSTTRS